MAYWGCKYTQNDSLSPQNKSVVYGLMFWLFGRNISATWDTFGHRVGGWGLTAWGFVVEVLA